MQKYICPFLIVFALDGCSSGSQNAPPTVSVSGPTEVIERAAVTLQSNAADIDGTIESYRWLQVSGPEISPSSYSDQTLEFTAPEVETDQTLVFSLEVQDNTGARSTSAEWSIRVQESLADLNPLSQSQITEDDRHASVFISSFVVDIDPKLISTVSFLIEPKQTATAAPIFVSTAVESLSQSDSSMIVPIFGLYSDYINTVTLDLVFVDGSSLSVTKEVSVSIYEDNPINTKVNFPVSQGNKPSFSYFYLKSRLGLHILDIDGDVRWAASAAMNTNSSIYDKGAFTVFLDDDMHKLALSGEMTTSKITQTGLSNIKAHHDVDKGRAGYLVEIDADKEGRSATIIESLLLEIDSEGNTVKEWDFGTIFKEFIESEGYDSSNFVRDGIDWFHMNSAIYDPSDDSIVASSRENFVVKIDYDSGEILWLLGDETKHWYVNYPPLQALSLSSSDVKPIGQHALSLVDGELMLFNNGQFSFNSPDGAPQGEVLTSSPASRYKVDLESRNAEITWTYDPFIYSDICSSVFRDQSTTNGDYLVHYAAVDRLDQSDPPKPTRTVIQAIDDDRTLLFEFELQTRFCQTAWQSRPLPELTTGTL